MGAFRATGRWSWIMLSAIFAPVVLLAAVALMTWRSERRYAAMTQQVIHDYAAVAAWQYARRANAALHDEAMYAFRGLCVDSLCTAAATPGMHLARIMEGRSDSSAALLRAARTAFVFDPSSRRLISVGDSLDDATRRMLENRLAPLGAHARRDEDPHRVIFDSSGGRARAVALWTVSPPDRPVGDIYGLIAHPSALAPKLAALIAEPGLLPATSAGARITARDLAIRLHSDEGGVVFSTPIPIGATAATDTIGLRLSRLGVTVDIPPHLVDALLVGGAPPSQMPGLALMILLALCLATFAVRHERRARELDRLRTRFVANVSHELRTPLAQISMFAETLKLGRERTTAERRQFATIIFAEARRLTALVESVLRFSRSEGKHERLRLEPLDLRADIESALEAFAPIADAAGAAITVRGGPDVHGNIDRSAFRQIILNLLDNSVKHGGPGVTVEIGIREKDGEALVVVEDSGAGIPAEWRDEVFQPFVRVDHAHVSGAGIGLAVVRDLATAHGGRAWAEASPLGGARIVVAVSAALPRTTAKAVTRTVNA